MASSAPTDAPDDQLVRRTDLDGVATIELHRPRRKNALIPPMLDELTAHFEAVSRDQSVNAVVLCGAGGAFCSGLDLTEYNSSPPPTWLSTASESIRTAHIAIARCPQPVVVALERYAINGGAAFALAGDLLVVGDGAWLQVGEVRLGMAAPMNLAWLVARHPLATVLQIVLPGNRLAGPELHRLGIAHEVVDDGDVRVRAEALAADIAGCPPGAGRALKTTALALAAVDPHHDAAAWFDRAAELSPAAAPPPSSPAPSK